MISQLGKDQRNRYLSHLQSLQANLDGLMEVEQTAQGFVFSFADNQQFTAFYPGCEVTALEWNTHLEKIQTKPANTDLAVIAPFPTTLTKATLGWLTRNLHPNRIIWNPGQYTALLTQQDYLELANYCGWIVSNAGEMDFLDRLGPKLDHINYIRTDGPNPIKITTPQGSVEVSIPRAAQIVDPTGCGDAFIAGMAAQLNKLLQTDINTWPNLLEDACLQAQACLAQQGTQCH